MTYKPFNSMQRAVAQVYGMGDYAHLTHEDETKTIGDTLFRFIILELSDIGQDRDEAMARMHRAIEDIEVVITALWELKPDGSGKR